MGSLLPIIDWDNLQMFLKISNYFATSVFANPGDMHLDVPRPQWAGDEAFCVQHPWMSPHCFP